MGGYRLGVDIGGTFTDLVMLDVWMLEPGQADTVARRVREVLKSA